MDKFNRGRFLDVEYIQEKLDAGYNYTEDAKGRDLVLVIGITGVGKSTTCNYLLNHLMREITFRGRPVIETVDETDIKIGHNVESETLYAMTVFVDNVPLLQSNSICLLDCPGFLGNKAVEDRVIESISTELAIRNARQVKGILILISLNVLLECRLTDLRELLKTLISLFKDPVEMVQYSIFVITKKNKHMPVREARDITIGTLNSLKDYCEKQAKWLYDHQNLSSSEKLTYIDYDRLATYFSAVLAKPENIILIDPLDNGESRNLILNHINKIKPRRGYIKRGINYIKNAVGIDNQNIRPITIDDFNFSEYDENRTEFNKTIYDRAHDGYLLIRAIQGYKELNLNLFTEMKNCETTLSILKQLQTNLVKEGHMAEEDKSQFSKIDFNSIKNLELFIVENEKHINSLKSEIDQILASKDKLRKELESIDNDIHLIFLQKTINKNVNWLKFFGWEEMKFNADTGNSAIQIVRVDKQMENGSWLNEDNRINNGIYRITYKSDYHARPAKASVKTFIKTKDEAGNKIRIEEINNEILELNKKQENIKLKVAGLKCNNQTFRSTVELATNSKVDYKNSLEQTLKECDKNIQLHNSRIIKIQQDREKASTAGLTSLQELDNNRRKFDIIVSIAAVLEFPSSLISCFISQYTDFLSDIDTYRRIFDNNNLDLLPHLENNGNLKDSIICDGIKELQRFTSVGTMFDVSSLLKQFEANNESTLPSAFEHENSPEQIEHLSNQNIPDIQSYLNKQQNLNHSAKISSQSYTKSEINQMTANQLKDQKDALVEEIHIMKEQLEIKETELDKICRQLKKVSGIDSEDNLLSFYTKSEINQKTVNQFDLQECSYESHGIKMDKSEPESSTSVAKTDTVKIAVLKNPLSEECDQKAEVNGIPVENRLLLNSLSNNLCHEDSQISESLLEFDVISNNGDLNININNEQCSEISVVKNGSNTEENGKSFESSICVSSDKSDAFVSNKDEILNEDDCVCRCPCGRVKNTITFPCKHFYFCEQCAPQFFEYYHRCPVCKNRIKDFDKIF